MVTLVRCPAQIGQEGCPLDQDEETIECNPQNCPRFDQWSGWGSCSVSCGGGEQARMRTCLYGAAGDLGCQGLVDETRFCNGQVCGGDFNLVPNSPTRRRVITLLHLPTLGQNCSAVNTIKHIVSHRHVRLGRNGTLGPAANTRAAATVREDAAGRVLSGTLACSAVTDPSWKSNRATEYRVVSLPLRCLHTPLYLTPRLSRSSLCRMDAMVDVQRDM